MEILLLSKWVAFKDNDVIGDDNEILHQFKEGDIIQIVKVDIIQPYPYYTNVSNFLPLSKNEILNNFIALSEFREQQINIILNE